MKPQMMALALLATGVPHAQAQVYKCPDPHGRTVIQQAPCTGGQELDVKPASGYDNPANAARARLRAEREGNAQDILLAISEGRPAIGMNEDQLRMALGTPTRINRANYQGRTSDQWVYYSRGQSWFVYVRDGRVSSFQNSETTSTGSSHACPSAMDIRNLETSASSVTITQERRRELQREVVAAKACR